MSEFDQLFLSGGDFGSAQEESYNFDFPGTSFTGVNTGLEFDGTVSPHDIIMSASGSTAFPSLDTPDTGYLESPAMVSSGLNTSPMDDALLDKTLDYQELDSYAPLFPQDGSDQFARTASSDNIQMQLSFNSLSATSQSAAPSPMVRQKSSPGRPPITGTAHLRKHSLSSGVVKAAAKSRKSLPDIVIEDNDDKETAKRKKNTAAARKSRQRKQECYDAMDSEIQRLRAMVYRLGGNPDDDVQL